jgi:serine/threonine-protein kinase
MRTGRSTVALLGALAVLAGGCSKTPRPFATDIPAGNPVGIAVAADGTVYYGGNAPFVGIRVIGDDGRVALFAGTPPTKGGPLREADGFVNNSDIGNPGSIAISPDGTLYILDQLTQKVVRIGKDHKATTLLDPATSDVHNPRAIAIDASGNVYMTEPVNNRVRKIDAAGTSTNFAGVDTEGDSGDGGPATSAQMAGPTGIAVDTAGNVYVAERSGDRIRKIDPSGTISTYAGTGESGSGGDGGPATAAQFTEITAMAIDTQGNLYVLDTGAERVRKIDAAGTISTLAGTGDAGFTGDLGPATAAALCYPEGIAVDIQGRVYIADTFSNRVRRVGVSGTIATIAGTKNTDGGPECEAPG